MEDTVTSIKEFIKSYIETYQACLNTTNSDFILELVKSSDTMQELFIPTPVTNKKGLTNEEFIKAEAERTKQIFKQILSGLNDLDETLETSKQVKMHKNLTHCYFNFIRKNVLDFVPKRITHKMVYFVLNNIDRFMYDRVLTPYVVSRSLDQALVEEESAVEDRIRSEQLLNAVNRALKCMMDIQCI